MQYLLFFKIFTFNKVFSTISTWAIINKDNINLLGDIPKTKVGKCDINMSKA